MSEQEINIAIAEACGWTKIREADYCESYINPYEGPVLQYWQGLSPSGGTEEIPDYCKDLNAMHEAEKTLLTQCGNDPQDDLWIDYLANLLHAAPLCLREHATARQRADAFLQTIGKLKEGAK